MKIAIDLDEIIAGFLDAFIKYHNNTYKTTFHKSDFFSYQFWKVIGGTREEAIDKVYGFHDSHYFDEIEPLDGAIEAIKNLKTNNVLYLITSRQDDFIEKTRIWIEKHLPNIFDKILHSNAYPKNGTSRKKSDLCDRLNVDALIEDNLDYVIECIKQDRKIILFRYPWNEQTVKPKGIYVVSGWNETLELL